MALTLVGGRVSWGPQAPYSLCSVPRREPETLALLALSCTWVNQGKQPSCFPFSDLRALLFAERWIWPLPEAPPPAPPATPGPVPSGPHPTPTPSSPPSPVLSRLAGSPPCRVAGRTQPLPPPQFLCTVIAILLHYVYMSTFAWTFVESLHVYRMLTEVRNIDAGPMRFYSVVGWGIPAIVTGEHSQSGHARPGTGHHSGTRRASQEPTSGPPSAGGGAVWPPPGHLAPTSVHRSVITQCLLSGVSSLRLGLRPLRVLSVTPNRQKLLCLPALWTDG